MLTAGSYEDRARERTSRAFALYSPERWHREHPVISDKDRRAAEDEQWRYAGEEE